MKTIGKIVNTKGLKGEVKILSSSDFKEERFKKGSKLFLKKENEYQSLTVSKWYVHKNFDIVKFKEINYVDDGQELVNQQLYGKELEENLLSENEFFFDDLLNNVVFNEKEKIGVVEEVFDQASRTYLKVKKENNKNILIPFVEEFIQKVDEENKAIYITPIEGLLDD